MSPSDLFERVDSTGFIDKVQVASDPKFWGWRCSMEPRVGPPQASVMLNVQANTHV